MGARSLIGLLIIGALAATLSGVPAVPAAAEPDVLRTDLPPAGTVVADPPQPDQTPAPDSPGLSAPGGPGTPPRRPSAWPAAAMAALAAVGGFVIWRRRLYRPVPAPTAGEPGGDALPWHLFMVVAVLLWMSHALGAVTGRMFVGFFSGSSTPTAPSPTPPPPGAMPLGHQGVIQLGGLAGVLLAAAFVLAALPGVRRAMGLRFRWCDLARGAGAFALVFPIVGTLGFLSLLVAGAIARLAGMDPPGGIAHVTLNTLTTQPMGAGWWMVVAGVVVGAPIAEELIYRAALQTGVRRALGSPAAAILVTSAVFTVQHLGAAAWHALPALFVLSAAFGVAYERTGRITAPIAMHMLFNAANIAVAVLTT
ncbi:MAG: CPBP family intramembrane metalloprotease [Phycisphaerales bacterium]|nr:CPBP family intramembrane metalloprotease [Phycisphaerales bacterium]